MCFNSKKCCISIWSSWYSILIVFIHAVLIRDRLNAILDLKKSLNDPSRRHQGFNELWWKPNHDNSISKTSSRFLSLPKSDLNEEYTARICLTSLSIIFSAIFFFTSNKKIGNFSNDGVKLGRDFFGEKLHHHNHMKQSSDSISIIQSKEASKRCQIKLVGLIWRHFLPINSTLHLLSIIFLLIQDLIYDQNNMVVHQINLMLNKSCLNQNSTQCLVDILINLKNENNALSQNSFLFEKIAKHRLELISVCLAYLTMSIRYGSVFWYTNKTLAYVISSIGLFNMFEQLFQLYIFLYIYKQNMFDNLFKSAQVELSVTMTDYGPNAQQTLLINNHLKLYFLYSFLSLSILSSLIPIYSFSYLKYKERYLIEENLFIKSGLQEKLFDSSSIDKMDKFLDGQCLKTDLEVAGHKNNCFNYCPHLIATLQLVVICALKLPFSYDLIIYFNMYKDNVLMVAIINEILHTILLLFVWLILTLKTEWQMHLRTSFSVCHWTYHLRLSEKSKQKEDVKTVSAKVENESDFFNSDTLYRDEIRKSSRNLLQQNRNSASVVPAYVRPENRLNRMSQPTYLCSSTPSSRFNIAQHVASNLEIPVLNSPGSIHKSFNQNVPSTTYNQTVLYLKRPSASEYESRV